MIRNVRIAKETEKAYLFTFVYDKKQLWVPKYAIKSIIEKEVKIPTGIHQVDISDNFYNENYKKWK